MKPQESMLRAFIESHPEDAARAFETLERPEAIRLVKSLPMRVAIDLLGQISPHSMGPIVDELDVAYVRKLLSEMTPRAATVVLLQLGDAKRDAVMAELDDAVAKPLKELSKYNADTAGGMMDPRVATLSIEMTAQQAIAKIRKTPRDALHYLYVTDRGGHLVGVLSMRDLLLAAPRDLLKTIVNENVLSVSDISNREEVVNLMRERGYLAMPVVDFEGRLVGVIKHGDALQASQIEAFEDLQKIVGAGADERALSPVSTVVKSRLPWLYVNLGTAFLAAAVVGMFENVIAEMAALAVLLPVVAGQGGNTGSQSLAIVMRGLALREIIPGVKRRVIVKEAIGGMVNGISVAVVSAAAVFAWRIPKGDSMMVCTGLALVIAIAMVINMGAAALAGAAIPMILKKLGRDPAQSAAIFLTTVTDIVGFAAFLGLAVLFGSMLK